MKAEILEVVKRHTIPGELGGRNVLYLTEGSVWSITKDLEKLLKKAGAPPKNEEVETIIDSAIEHMNEVWGTSYRKNTEANRKVIRARLTDGATKDEIFLVIEEMGSAWLNDPHMAKYLRPVTIFTPSKFEGYLNQSMRKRGLRDNMIYVSDPYGNKKRITKAQFQAAEGGYFKRLD